MEDYISIKKVSFLLKNNRWVFAKTMPKNPHWYTLRKEWVSDEDFVNVVTWMRKFGYNHFFFERKYTIITINKVQYWTMGAPINLSNEPHTILINKAVIGNDHLEIHKCSIFMSNNDEFYLNNSYTENEEYVETLKSD